MIPPSPFLSADPLTAENPAAALAASPETAAAGPIPDPPSNEGRHQGASATDYPFDAGATDHIAEIFIGADKLDEHRFVLDEAAFMAEIEDVPLFMRRMG